MTLWDMAKCNSSLAWGGKVYDTFMCAGYYSGVRSVCRVSFQQNKDNVLFKAFIRIKGGTICFLAHLSQRLIGELIVYSCSGVRPSVVRRRCTSSYVVVHNFKHLLLRNRLPDQSQILCGASLGRGKESLFAASWSHDQDGRHANIW